MFEVKREGMSTVVKLGDRSVSVTWRQVRRRVPAMRGDQIHKGFVAVISTPEGQQDCGHFIHQKASAARECGVSVAKRVLRVP